MRHLTLLRKKGMQASGKMAKMAGKAGRAAAKAAAKLLRVGIVKIVGAIVGAVGLPVALIMALIITVCVILASFVPFTDDESKTEEQVKKVYGNFNGTKRRLERGRRF